jgi:hypothetical protein
MNGYTTALKIMELQPSLRTNQDETFVLSIVDLAGSERSKRTGAFREVTRQKEATMINSSLMTNLFPRLPMSFRFKNPS